MKCKELFDTVMYILAENDGVSEVCDYAERFPYMLAMFCNDNDDIDKHYRKANGLPEGTPSNYFSLGFADDFPFCEKFATPVAYYIASMLVGDENMELADRLFDRYSDRLSVILSGIPGTPVPIKEVY